MRVAVPGRIDNRQWADLPVGCHLLTPGPHKRYKNYNSVKNGIVAFGVL